ncbi:MAG TPA: ATP phosphoribosyltransferase regulatory subunit [Polyangiales bacterium]|nr:ATP phosphoribosyltransferase regulatory subunit [Polyangiales bacterium]
MPPSARKGTSGRLAIAGPGLPMTPPGGMRDLLPPASMTRTLLWQRLMETFDRYGYQRVTTPPVEYAEVIERGLGTVDRRELVRFVEPDSGEVALLRPDITPQIARIIATRLQDRPPPWRLSYEGTIIRRRRGRARRQHQVLQCGIELVGMKGPEADAEVIEVAARACEHVGLDSFLVELAQVKIGTEVLDHVPEAARPAVIETLAAKDATTLERLLTEAGVVAAERKRLRMLCDLYGDRSVIAEARRRLKNAAARRALDELERVVERLESADLGSRVAIDLGDLRRHSYYTGVSMTLLAEGPGEPLGMGGRYDDLLGRYDAPAPATGFAFEVDNVLWALTDAGVSLRASLPPRVLVAGGSPARRRAMAEQWRAQGARVAVVPSKTAESAREYAIAWDYDLLIWQQGKRAHLIRPRDGRSRALEGEPDEALFAWARVGNES